MGDIADMYADMYDTDGPWDCYEDGPGGGSAKQVTCRYCGTAGLYWDECRGRWFLHEGLNPHRCDYGISKNIQKLKATIK